VEEAVLDIGDYVRQRDNLWYLAQILRILSLIFCSVFAGASLMGKLQAQTQIGERLRAVEVTTQTHDRALEAITPQVLRLQEQYAQLYGMGIAASLIIGLINAGQLVVAMKRKP
jgi:hypothetical protein